MKKWSWNIWKELKRICQPQEQENSVPWYRICRCTHLRLSVQPRWGAKGSSPWSAPKTFIGPWRMPWWQDLLGTIVDMLFTESKCGKEGGTRLIGETDRRPLRQIRRAEAEEQERKWRWVGPLAGCLLQPGSGSCAVNRRPEGGNTYFTALLLSFET